MVAKYGWYEVREGSENGDQNHMYYFELDGSLHDSRVRFVSLPCRAPH
jgi:hypothetical protein